jgi:hypothetical protein
MLFKQPKVRKFNFSLGIYTYLLKLSSNAWNVIDYYCKLQQRYWLPPNQGDSHQSLYLMMTIKPPHRVQFPRLGNKFSAKIDANIQTQ